MQTFRLVKKRTLVQTDQNSEANCRRAAGLIAVDTARATRLQWAARSKFDCKESWTLSGKKLCPQTKLAWRAGDDAMQRPAL